MVTSAGDTAAPRSSCLAVSCLLWTIQLIFVITLFGVEQVVWPAQSPDLNSSLTPSREEPVLWEAILAKIAVGGPANDLFAPGIGPQIPAVWFQSPAEIRGNTKTWKELWRRFGGELFTQWLMNKKRFCCCFCCYICAQSAALALQLPDAKKKNYFLLPCCQFAVAWSLEVR